MQGSTRVRGRFPSVPIGLRLCSYESAIRFPAGEHRGDEWTSAGELRWLNSRAVLCSGVAERLPQATFPGRSGRKVRPRRLGERQFCEWSHPERALSLCGAYPAGLPLVWNPASVQGRVDRWRRTSRRSTGLQLELYFAREDQTKGSLVITTRQR